MHIIENKSAKLTKEKQPNQTKHTLTCINLHFKMLDIKTIGKTKSK